MDVLTDKVTPFSLVLTKADKLGQVKHVKGRVDDIVDSVSNKGLL